MNRFLQRLKRKRADVVGSMLTYTEDAAKRAAMFEQLTTRTICCIEYNKCEVCDRRHYRRWLNQYALMYGHDRCIHREFAKRYFNTEFDLELVLKVVRADEAYTDKRMRLIAKRFEKIRKWLHEPMNVELSKKYEGDILRLTCRSTMTCKRTLVRALFEVKSRANYTPLFPNVRYKLSNPVPYLQHLEAKGAKIRKHRHQNLKWECGLWQINPKHYRSNVLVKRYIGDIRESNVRTLVTKLVRLEYLKAQTAQNPWRVSGYSDQWLEVIVRNYRWRYVLPEQKRLPWMDYKLKRMRLWRGIAHFIGRVQIMRKDASARDPVPPVKRRKKKLGN